MLGRLIRLEPRERAAVVEAALLLVWSSAVLKLVRFRRLATRLGTHMAESAPAGEPELEEARRVQRAVERVAPNLPWHPVCLPQAVAAQRMLRRRGIPSTLYLGVDPDRGYDAHAWVRVGPLVVTGTPATQRFVVVTSFA